MECECCCELVQKELVWQGCENQVCSAVVCLSCQLRYTHEFRKTGCMYCNPLEKPYVIEVDAETAVVRSPVAYLQVQQSPMRYNTISLSF